MRGTGEGGGGGAEPQPFGASCLWKPDTDAESRGQGGEESQVLDSEPGPEGAKEH